MDIPYYFGEHLRWGLGWETPNQAGAFLATLIPLFWLISALRQNKRLPVQALVGAILLLELGLWFLLAKTYSRGALVGITLAALWYVAWQYQAHGRAFRFGWTVPARVAGIILCFGITGFFARVDPGYVVQDPSAMNRLVLWKGGLEMIATEPLKGWGSGDSGRIFMNWFQPVEREEGYAGMVNSFLHVASERGLPVLTLVIALLLSVILTACFLRNKEDRVFFSSHLATATGSVWIAFIGAQIFSTLWIIKALWIVPLVASLVMLILLLAVQPRQFLMAYTKAVTAGSLTALLSAAWLFLAGSLLRINNPLHIVRQGEGIAIQTGGQHHSDAVYLIYPDKTTLGPVFGREFRKLLIDSRTPPATWIILGDDAGFPDVSPATKGILIFGDAWRSFGTLPPDIPVWLIHPTGNPDPALKLTTQTTLILPGLDAPGRLNRWKRKAGEDSAVWLMQPGIAQDTRATWPDYILKRLGDKNES